MSGIPGKGPWNQENAGAGEPQIRNIWKHRFQQKTQKHTTNLHPAGATLSFFVFSG